MDTVIDEKDSNETLFSSLDSLEDNDNSSIFEEPSDDKKKESDEKTQGKKIDDPKYERLEKKTKDMAEHIRQQSETIKGLQTTAGITQKMKKVFSDEDDEKEEQGKELGERETFDEDPFNFVKKSLKDMENRTKADRLADIEDYVVPLNTAASLRDAREEIDKKYNIDWNNKTVIEKLKKQLSVLDAEYKQKNPVNALIRAAYNAKVLKKRSASELPYMEEGMGSSFVSKKRREQEADNYIKGIKEASVKKLFDKI